MKDCIIIPTYNESENISRLIRSIYSTIQDISITVVDDSSPDGTALVVQELKNIYRNLSIIMRKKKTGLGGAYLTGFKKVLSDRDVRRVITMDADLSHDPRYLPEMLKASVGRDLVIGSRYIKGGSNRKMNFIRRYLSTTGNIYCRLVTCMPVRDCTSGFMVINGDLLRSCNLSGLPNSGFAFVMELKHLLLQRGASFIEIPIDFNDRLEGRSKISSRMVIDALISPWRMICKKKINKDL